jgi:hypothetical protein
MIVIIVADECHMALPSRRRNAPEDDDAADFRLVELVAVVEILPGLENVRHVGAARGLEHGAEERGTPSRLIVLDVFAVDVTEALKDVRVTESSSSAAGDSLDLPYKLMSFGKVLGTDHPAA